MSYFRFDAGDGLEAHYGEASRKVVLCGDDGTFEMQVASLPELIAALARVVDADHVAHRPAGGVELAEPSTTTVVTP